MNATTRNESNNSKNNYNNNDDNNRVHKPMKMTMSKNVRQKSTSWAHTNLCQMTASRQMAWWQKTKKKERKKKLCVSIGVQQPDHP